MQREGGLAALAPYIGGRIADRRTTAPSYPFVPLLPRHKRYWRRTCPGAGFRHATHIAAT